MLLIDDISQYIQKQALIPVNVSVVIGVSGGADSLALLHILSQLRHKLGFQLHAASLDHGVRGQASADDVQFVRQMAQAWDVPIITGKLTDESSGKASSEEALRVKRYDFLARAAREIGAERVAVAHHADDQAETVLMRIIRGAGMTGLRGILPQSPMPYHPDLLVIRPLLSVTRMQIEAYCRENDLHPRQDATNQDMNYLRNRLRLETLPNLRLLNPLVDRGLSHLADTAALEDDYMASQLDNVRREIGVEVTGERVIIPRSGFAQLHPALQRRLLLWGAAQINRSDQQVGYVHLLAALDVALHGQVGARALLPGKLHLRVDYEHLLIEAVDTAPRFVDRPLLNTDEEIVVHFPGETLFPDGHWALYVTLEPPVHYHARLSLPPNSRISIRARREGDRFAPLGMEGHTQKLNRWMINRKIPQALRASIPLLLVDGTIAAIIFGNKWPIAEMFAIKAQTSQNVYFSLKKL
jgi:tRNA(Ile)-lysidine synthase